jgi:hypothetical protein
MKAWYSVKRSDDLQPQHPPQSEVSCIDWGLIKTRREGEARRSMNASIITIYGQCSQNRTWLDAGKTWCGKTVKALGPLRQQQACTHYIILKWVLHLVGSAVHRFRAVQKHETCSCEGKYYMSDIQIRKPYFRFILRLATECGLAGCLGEMELLSEQTCLPISHTSNQSSPYHRKTAVW